VKNDRTASGALNTHPANPRVSPLCSRWPFVASEWASAFTQRSSRFEAITCAGAGSPMQRRKIAKADYLHRSHGSERRTGRETPDGGIKGKRAKPSRKPNFPGIADVPTERERPKFPGYSAPEGPRTSVHIPKLQRPPFGFRKASVHRTSVPVDCRILPQHVEGTDTAE
jgi:hypothetical protein